MSYDTEVLTVWMLTDGLPGHANQSKGIIRALKRHLGINVYEVNVNLHHKAFRAPLRALMHALPAVRRHLFSAFYTSSELPVVTPDLIVSSGGDTLGAAISLKHAFHCPIVFSGTPKGYGTDLLDLIITVVPLVHCENNLVLELPPSVIEPGHPNASNQKIAAMLLGASGAGYDYQEKDWQALVEGMKALSTQGVRWLLTTSRRTGSVTEALLKKMIPSEILKEAIWFQDNPAKVMDRFLRESDYVFVSEDSLTMVAEAIFSAKPVCTLQPEKMQPVANDESALTKYAAHQRIIRVRMAALASLDLKRIQCAPLPDVDGEIYRAVAPLLNKVTHNFTTTPSKSIKKRILWWGRFGNYGPNYPRNRTLMKCLGALSWEVVEFRPHLSALGDIEVAFSDIGKIDAVWVPCFRQRDLGAAARWAKKHKLPLIFDPLISAYDKRINEKKKFTENSWQARRLLKWEHRLFVKADTLIADTECHRQYFIDTLGCDARHVSVIPVSAEEDLFYPLNLPQNDPLEFLFFGTFIGLQGPAVVAQAIEYYSGVPIRLTFLGKGPERKVCEHIVSTLSNPLVTVSFEDWIPFHDLPGRINRADVCLGVFGEGGKALRVIPNKVYQAMACGKPVITLRGDAYPTALLDAALDKSGIVFVPPADPVALATAMAALASADLKDKSKQAYVDYLKHFSNARIKSILENLLQCSSY